MQKTKVSNKCNNKCNLALVNAVKSDQHSSQLVGFELKYVSQKYF